MTQKCFSLWTYTWFHLCFYTFFTQSITMFLNTIRQKNLHDESLFSLPKFCLLHLEFHFHHYYFCDFLILIQTRQIFLLCQLNISISIFQRLTSFKLLKCEFSPTYAQSFDVQTLSPSFSIWVPFPHVFFYTGKTWLT